MIRTLGSLSIIMILTRFPFASETLHLLDASWAIFFVLGRVRATHMVKLFSFLWFCCLGWVIDIAAIDGDFVGAYCFTPAYAGLPVAYTLLSIAGLLSVRVHLWLIPCALAAIGAFVVTNAFFFYWSGYFEAMPLGDYARTVLHYLPTYAGATVLYCAVWQWLAARIGSVPVSELS